MTNDMIKKQRFGVEIEMTGIRRVDAAHVIANYFGTEVKGPFGLTYKERRIKGRSNRVWKVMRDSSVKPEPAMDEYKVEVVTPPLKYDDMEDLQNIIRKLREAGAKVNASCGIHVHIDGSNHTPKSLLYLINFMTCRQDLIYESLEIGERANRWCKKLNDKILKALKSHDELTFDKVKEIWYSDANDGYRGRASDEHYNETRYHGVNLHAFFTKGTVEFRLFNSTLHAGKVKAYIQLCLAISGWAITTDSHISFRASSQYTPEKKVQLMRSVLTNRLGLTGKEFHTCRLHLLNPLRKAAGLPLHGLKTAA